jgi:hypothetical protein
MDILVNKELFEFGYANNMEFSIVEYDNCWTYKIEKWNADGEVCLTVNGTRNREGFTRNALFNLVHAEMRILAK